MKEHPILFCGEMVRAILEGRKTQTRRIVNPQPSGVPPDWYPDAYNHTLDWTFWGPRGSEKQGCCHLPLFRNPYGQPGDHLWVRETWIRTGCGILYRADIRDGVEGAGLGGMYGGWKSSIHMRREHSRITLELVSVRAEQLHDISEEDAKSEGIEAHPPSIIDDRVYRRPFEILWDLLNAKRGFGWASNPWVWRLEFKRIKP